ncbi:MAG TPA: DUF3187 family protein [Burkholderiales bacterium]|nr:DUF3187 family protein [Burkholderiales bacterium]
MRAGLLLTVLAVVLALPASAQATPAEDNAKVVSPTHYGLLRERDLTPFGFLRLDMRPAHAVSAPPGNWAVEVELGYQNTWALSRNAKNYLDSLQGRREIGPAEIQAIRDLPGEAYLVDFEMGLLDVTLHRRLTERWSAYAALSGVFYRGGFMDGGIEWFHDTFGFPPAGRPAAKRNDVNVIFDLKSVQLAQPDLPESGVLDPVFGVRYQLAEHPAAWNLVIGGAVKVPVAGERPFLSTGHWDFGTQFTLQRFMQRHAAYASLAAVHTRPSTIATASGTQIVPTAILGYEYKWTDHTNLNAQIYASPSIFKRADTDLDELRSPKYQVSLGFRYRIDSSVLTFAVTENVANSDNSPDIGFQLGWAYSPVFKR